MSLDSQKPSEEHLEPNIGFVSNPHAAHRHYPESFPLDGINVIRGFFMGAANIVPGVSGGTVALVLGHYQRLIDAVSHVDSQLAAHVISRRWKAAWDYVDARFLLAIGCGVVLGSVALAGMINWLFNFHMSETFAVFFGMILASVLIVRRQVTHWTTRCFVACAAGAFVAVMVGRLSPTDGGDSLVYLFLSAAVAICAMILPGISGAFILLMLGVYHPITGLIKNMAKGQIDFPSVLQFGVFALGCLFGLLAFSRILSWMLDHHRDVTMAALVGLMVGSVEKLCPLQVPTTETAGLKMKERVMQYISPGDWNGSLLWLVALAIGAAAFVLVLERVATPKVVTGHEIDG
ncbi:MAG: DUF368 domain-containing protein [Planctomycetales bacterium]|nr:DUF368 domain-containing protein [Planctomycetales bacterium]